MIDVVGGAYFETCIHPVWQELFGSGGRAASAIASLGEDVTLHTLLDEESKTLFLSRAEYEGFSLKYELINNSIRFNYLHPLSSPTIVNGSEIPTSFSVSGDKIIRFGMLEGSPIVNGSLVVYDPQDSQRPAPFHANGSKADRLAVVLNQSEASSLTGLNNASPEELAQSVMDMHDAEVVILKRGPLGALVYQDGKGRSIPVFRSERVWSIGSGDVFVSHFALNWFADPSDPFAAAHKASIATSYYCNTMGLPSHSNLEVYAPEAIRASERYTSNTPKVYLAGPFFTLSQRWLVEQARQHLFAMGLKVFSPIHDVGFGMAEDVVQKDIDGIKDCELMFAIVDGLDAGTIYEIGYARAIDRPVIVYCENESNEDKKMMEGSGCIISSDYTTAMYKTLWSAVCL